MISQIASALASDATDILQVFAKLPIGSADIDLGQIVGMLHKPPGSMQ